MQALLSETLRASFFVVLRQPGPGANRKEALMDIDIPATIRRWQRWHKTALLIAVLILLAYSGAYVWFLAR